MNGFDMSNSIKEKLIDTTAEYGGIAAGAAIGVGIGMVVLVQLELLVVLYLELRLKKLLSGQGMK